MITTEAQKRSGGMSVEDEQETFFEAFMAGLGMIAAIFVLWLLLWVISL